MPTVDPTSIVNGYGQIINDWVLADDRLMSGDITLSVNPPPSQDSDIVTAYFTLKQDTRDTDAHAITQVKITRTPGTNGMISPGPTNKYTNLLFNIFGANYEFQINAGTVYSWDIRAITAVGGVSLTIANGTVTFIQDITQTNNSGTPAAIPNEGQPQIRGFISTNPMWVPNLNTLYNIGDIYFNSQPDPFNAPVGWQCIGQGAPGVWTAFGSYQTTGGIIPPTNWLFGPYPPTQGTHGYADIMWNTNPQPGGNIGWVCLNPGTPGLWYAFGPISVVPTDPGVGN